MSVLELATAEPTAPAALPRGRAHGRPRGEWVALGTLLTVSAALYLWDLGASGTANQYYSAAALSGSQSWKAMFFGSLDASGAITVDKPPLAIWPMALLVKAFGLSSWTVLVPQALEGVAAVAVLHAAVRRSTGSAGAALVAGVVFATTPIAVLMFRYDNPDALLVLLLVAAAYATIRALEGPHAGRWLGLAGVLVGTGFMCKLLQAFMVLPSLVLVYALFAAVSPVRRVKHLMVALATTTVAAGWWIATVELWPAGSRPWIGGSRSNSVLELALGYNGVGRLTGHETAASATSGWHGTNLAHMVGVPVWTGVMWWVPAALILSIGALWVTRRARAPRASRAAIWMWLSWLAVNTLVFCLMAGIFHSYYTIVLAPAVAALVGIGGHVVWHGHRRAAAMLMTAASVASTIVAIILQGHQRGEMTALLPLVVVLGVAALSVILISAVPERTARRLVVLALGSTLLSPVAYSVATATTPHAGSGPQVGTGVGVVNRALPRQVVQAMTAGADRYDWVAAVPGARAAAAYELATRHPVIGIGGYKETDPSPTVDQFAAWVRQGRIHYYVDSTSAGPAGSAIGAWVRTHYSSESIAGLTLYDLSGATS